MVTIPIYHHYVDSHSYVCTSIYRVYADRTRATIPYSYR